MLAPSAKTKVLRNLLAVATRALLAVALTTVNPSPATKLPKTTLLAAMAVVPSYTLLAEAVKERAVMSNWLSALRTNKSGAW